MTKAKKRAMEDGYDRLVKLHPLIDKLNKKFQEEYLPSPHQTIDESMIAFKGRSSMKQYLPMKPTKRGYKVWCLQAGHTQRRTICCNLRCTKGRTHNDQPIKALLSLSENVQSGMQLFFDNYFTCAWLMETRWEEHPTCRDCLHEQKGLAWGIKTKQQAKEGRIPVAFQRSRHSLSVAWQHRCSPFVEFPWSNGNHGSITEPCQWFFGVCHLPKSTARLQHVDRSHRQNLTRSEMHTLLMDILFSLWCFYHLCIHTVQRQQ